MQCEIDQAPGRGLGCPLWLCGHDPNSARAQSHIMHTKKSERLLHEMISIIQKWEVPVDSVRVFVARFLTRS